MSKSKNKSTTAAPSNTELAAKIESAKQAVALLEAQAQEAAAALLADRTAKIMALPGQFGVEDHVALIKLIRQTVKPAGARKRGRASKITPEMKEKVVSLLKEGKTGAAVAEAVGISAVSVNNIKKAAGMVKARS